MTKFPIMLYNTKSTKKALVPPIPPPSSYEDAVGWAAIEAGYKTALRGSRKFTREAVLYDLYSEVNNVRLAARITPSGIGRVSILGVKRRIPRIRRAVRSVGTLRPAAGTTTMLRSPTRTSVSAPSLKS